VDEEASSGIEPTDVVMNPTGELSIDGHFPIDTPNGTLLLPKVSYEKTCELVP
jgi:hypothetical protein